MKNTRRRQHPKFSRFHFIRTILLYHMGIRVSYNKHIEQIRNVTSMMNYIATAGVWHLDDVKIRTVCFILTRERILSKRQAGGNGKFW